jgi:hypothetical protein
MHFSFLFCWSNNHEMRSMKKGKKNERKMKLLLSDEMMAQF